MNESDEFPNADDILFMYIPPEFGGEVKITILTIHDEELTYTVNTKSIMYLGWLMFYKRLTKNEWFDDGINGEHDDMYVQRQNFQYYWAEILWSRMLK